MQLEHDDIQPDLPDYGPQIEEFGSLLKKTQAELAEKDKTLSSLKSELGEQKSFADKLRKVFVGDEESKPDPYAQRQAAFEALARELDSAALEDQKKGGKGLPLTTKIGKELSDFARSTLSQNQKLEKELADLKKAVELQGNPAFQNMQRINLVAENMADEALEVMYPGEESKQVRDFMGNSIKQMVQNEIRTMVQNQEYDDLKKLNNPKAVRAMVNHFAAQILPPKAREILDNDRIKNEPANPKDLMMSFREASQKLQEAETPAEQRHWANIVESLRQDFLAETVGKRGGSINNILGGMIGK